jgi:hypothetical protein
MKKRTPKLTLHKETLRNLASGDLRKAAGGETDAHTFCLTDCPWCPNQSEVSYCYACPTSYCGAC